MLGRVLLVLLLLFFSITLRAQLKISGKVIDEKNTAIEFISIKIIDPKNKSNYTQTDSNGAYVLKNLEAGKYILTFSSLNFETKHDSFYLKQDTVINILLKENSNTLNDVQINAKKALIEKKIDRTVFNAENSVAAIGTDALELLAKIPGVRVLNDQVSLVGKGKVNIMVNDKLVQLSEDDLTNYLKSISSDNISKIEVITNPPAKYDAQGNNGLINIVLKKAIAEGFKGAFNSTFTQATHSTASVGGNLSYRKDKITLYTNLNIRKGSLAPFEQSNVFYPTQTWNIVNKDRNFRTVPSGQVGLDYQLSQKTLLGFSYNGGLTNFHSEENIRTTIFNSVQRLDSILNSDASAKIRSHYNAANLYLKQALDTTGKQITINADWFKFGDDKSRYFNNTSYAENGAIIQNAFAEYLSTSKQSIDLYTLKADVDLPFKTFKFSLGTKLSFIENESDLAFYQKRNEVYQADLAQTNLFNYKERTQALYVNLNKTIKKWDFQIGLRAEYTQIDGKSSNELNQNDYFQLFPTFYAVYRASETSNWGINYGRRINRPAYRKLNPFRWYSNQYVYAEGNPFLQPSYNNNIEISHVYNNVFTSALSFSHISNGFNDVNFIDASTNIQASKPINFITGYNYQLSNSVLVKPIKGWESSNQFDVFCNVSNSSIEQTLNNLKGFSAYFSTVNQFTLNKSKTIMGDVNFWFQFPAVDGLNNNRSQCNLDLGVKTLLFNKKIQIAVNATDILKTNQYRFNSLVNNIRQEYNNYYDSRQLRLTIRYIFGNEKIKQIDRKAGNEEERKRNN
ncbi:TonB-dependent receptor [Pedobacter frigidisoli]|uniref:TonB-dependent receptor n=1 Tax=Pedobacter frigidisoli TaxID=2530455 RepID=A0A4V2MNF1_9SPHI|nr:outer membrane beta-barrel protein [Pedobacter frigidisoli]TCD12536.1 TonB-dependent receptor [Pedobacter frigidisoli]